MITHQPSQKSKTHINPLLAFLFALLLTSLNSASSFGKQNGSQCGQGLSYEELMSVFQITDMDRLTTVLSQKCFVELKESSLYKTFERSYERQIGNVNHHYNELLVVGYTRAYEYRCSETAVCYNLLKEINDNALFYGKLEEDKYMYILKNQLDVVENRDIPDKNIGWGYGFKIRPVKASDWEKLNAKKLADTFPENNSERDRLEYRYARVDARTRSTSLDINAGDKLSLDAGGEIKFGEYAGSAGPNGMNGYALYSKISGFRHGSLLYRIGNGSWDYVTNKMNNITANNSGRLQLVVNDNSPNDNEGLFWANIKVIRSNGSYTPKVETTVAPVVADNKFAIRNVFKGKMNFELSRDKITWKSFSLDGSSQSDYFYDDLRESFFRIKVFKTKIYKITAGKKYKIEWNTNEFCYDLFADGDR